MPRIDPLCVRPLRTPPALGQAEVGDLGRAVGREQDVGRLQVAVDDAPLDAPRRWRRPAGSTSCAAGRAGQGVPSSRWSRLPPSTILQRKVRRPSASPMSMDLDDVRVLQLGRWPRPRQEADRRRRLGVDAGQDHLQGTGAVQPDLPGLVDDAHAAAAQLAQDLVAGDDRRGAVGRGGRGLAGVRRLPDPRRGNGGVMARWLTPPIARPGSISLAAVIPRVSGSPFGSRSTTIASGSDLPAPIVCWSRVRGSLMRAPSHAAGVDRHASRHANLINPLYGTSPCSPKG